MQSTLDRIAQNLADIGAISLEDYLDGHSPAPHLERAPSQGPTSASGESNAVTRLNQACQRAFRNTDALKFEFIEHADSRNKQCILTITKPDGMRRSYTTQPIYAKKSEAKSEAAKIAIDMGALDFLAGGVSQTGSTRDLARASVEASGGNVNPSDTIPGQETFVDDIEKCCLEWRAGRVTPRWVPFFDPKSLQKQGCALRIQLSSHVVRIYLSDPTFDTHPDAKGACAKAAILEGVSDFIKYGNGQLRPSSPGPPTSFALQCPPATTPWTLQAFYDSLPRPFPESFQTNDAYEINALGWMNNAVQSARGGKLVLSFFFTSDGPPGLHGCLLRLDRPGEYRASLVDARFPKRSDAKAAVCLQAMSEGIGDYVRSIAATVDSKVTPAMRSFSGSLVYPGLTSVLSKIDTYLHPHFVYDKERDAFGATLVVGLSRQPTSEQVRRYTVPNDYRSKADAKVAVICLAAEQGIVEFVRFRGGPIPAGYVSPYSLHSYNSEASRKRKQPWSVDDGEQDPPAKKKKKKGKRRAEAKSHSEVGRLTPAGHYLSVHPNRDQIHDNSGPSDIGLLQSVSAGGLCNLSQPGVGSGGGSDAAPHVVYGHRVSYSYAPSYPAVLDPRLGSGRGYGIHLQPGTYSGSLHAVDDESGPSRTKPGSSSRKLARLAEDAELEPGEVMSSAESEFSVSSSRNEDAEVPKNAKDTNLEMDSKRRERVNTEDVTGSCISKGKGEQTSPVNTITTVSRDGPGTMTTTSDSSSYYLDLQAYCARHRPGTLVVHQMQKQGRFQVWIVIGSVRFDLPTTYATAEEGRERVAKQVLAWLSKGSSGSRSTSS